MKSKNSYGYDEISTIILKNSAPYILSPLTFIFNKILIRGIFPDRTKYSIIKPLHKKGSNKELGNYRPISLLPVFSKVLEKLIYKRLYSFLENNRILSADQYGFSKKLSTSSATNALLTLILSAFEKNMYVGGLFCDMHKAFDTVNHKILLAKLQYYGIADTGTPIKLTESYLENRYQKVIITNNRNTTPSSSWERIKCGVPQGSILGPLLFLVYINDLAHIIRRHANPILFADDTSVIITSTGKLEFKRVLSCVLGDIIVWCKKNYLTLNLNKTQFIQFYTNHHKNLAIRVEIADTVIPTNNVKFLGLILENGLSWKAYNSELTIKLNKACYDIRAVKSLLSIKVITAIYFAYFHSVLSYGLVFWGNSPIAKKIFKLQKRVIHIIANKSQLDSRRYLFKYLNILTLPSQYIFSVMGFVLENRHLFVLNSDIHDRDTRNGPYLHIFFTHLTSVQRGVFHYGC